ncbi:MAG TPA: PD-(D/E)XK nuclease family protein [Thermoanaerobaculia bacterium]|nr:PD-(D/E)XK nuclease family protein [Thermoanaerobaculia bacterium]
MGSPLLTLAPYSEIAGRIAERLAASGRRDPLAPWSEEVVVASSGVAQAISAALLERFPNGIAGLQLQTLDTLARRIVNAAGDFPRAATDEERRLAMRTATRSVDDPLTATRGAASMLERSYRDVRDGGLSVLEFQRRFTAARSLRNRERIRLAVRVWQTYEKLITKLGAVDPADILGRACDLSSVHGPGPSVVLAGFYDMTGAQLALVRALQSVDRLSAVYVPFDPHDAPGWSFANEFVRLLNGAPASAGAALEIREPAVSLREAKTREEEIRETCRDVAQLLDSGVTPQSIGVVARSLDPYDVQLFGRFSRESGFSISESVALPLSAHRFGRTALLLLRLRERNFLRGDVLEIVRGGLRLSTRINPENADYETRYAGLGGGRSADLRQRTFKSPVVGDYIDAVAELEALTERIDASWLPNLIEQFRVETETDLAAIDALQTIAALFSRAAAWNRPLDASSLIDAIESASIPRSEARGPRPVWLSDVMRLRGRSFTHLFAVRLQDETLPQRRVEDPLLVDADRRLLGLREIGDGRPEEQLLFRIISGASTDSLTLSFAASDGFGKPLRKSNYLRHVSGAPRLPARRPAAGTAAAPRSLQLLVRSGTRSVFDGYIRNPLVREKAEIALQSAAPTHLEDFGECPQKFFWKRILRVRSIDDPDMEVQINHREKGNLDHRILERFYRDALPLDRLDEIVDQEFDAFEEQRPPLNEPIRKIERRVAKTLLRHFVTDDRSDLAALSMRPVRFEYRFEPYVLDIDGTSLRIEGAIDRIDEGGGNYRIVDYKSGKALRHVKLAAKIERGVRLQLALYAMAAASFFQTTADHVSGAIKPIAGADKPSDFTFALAEHEVRLRETLALFVEAIRRGDFPAFPNEDENDFNSCKYCPVNHSCRTRHDSDERRAVLRAGQPRALFEDPA